MIEQAPARGRPRLEIQRIPILTRCDPLDIKLLKHSGINIQDLIRKSIHATAQRYVEEQQSEIAVLKAKTQRIESDFGEIADSVIKTNRVKDLLLNTDKLGKLAVPFFIQFCDERNIDKQKYGDYLRGLNPRAFNKTAPASAFKEYLEKNQIPGQASIYIFPELVKAKVVIDR
jgi:hypothetical protein